MCEEIIWSIYSITNIINNKVYIGQSKDCKTRWSRHKSDARLNKKHNYHLYESMRKYGIQNFEFQIIAQTKIIDEIDGLEIEIIAQYNSSNRELGYNISKGGQANKLVSSETRDKISRANKGHQPRLGMKTSKETKELLSLINKGKKYRLGVKTSKETKELLSLINKGKKATEFTKNKMSKSMIGKNKGKNNGMYGKKSVNAKLTQEQVKNIRAEYSLGNISMLKLSQKYNVSKKTILNIIHGLIYRE